MNESEKNNNPSENETGEKVDEVLKKQKKRGFSFNECRGGKGYRPPTESLWNNFGKKRPW